ncbi:MAG TPA: hypothetical protein VFF76_01070 [Holophagaceae bacterium]|jgi:hypothetical protein|nr:hypothetical protein [Holophagaceae bacterium]
MTQISNPPAFPQAGTRSKTTAIAILTAIVVALIAGAAVAARAHTSRHAAELAPAPPSYADALRQAEAEDMAKGVTPEMASELRAKGTADAAPKPVQRGQF